MVAVALVFGGAVTVALLMWDEKLRRTQHTPQPSPLRPDAMRIQVDRWLRMDWPRTVTLDDGRRVTVLPWRGAA